MTPGADWAERKAREVARSLPPSDFGSHRAIMAFAAALREAVKAEREECAEMATDANKIAHANTPFHAAKLIAAAIRERPL